MSRLHRDMVRKTKVGVESGQSLITGAEGRRDRANPSGMQGSGRHAPNGQDRESGVRRFTKPRDRAAKPGEPLGRAHGRDICLISEKAEACQAALR